MASPPKSISDKLRLLCQERQRIDANEIVFNPSDYYFGFKVMHQLFPVDLHEVKGYPCMAFNEISDPVKFGVKVIPLDNQFDVGDKHPALVESRLLKEFTNLVLQHVTPHVTFFFKNLDTHNSARAVTTFPLRGQKNYVHKTCHVLIAEYVSGGSIEELLYQREKPVSVAEWKYIIFSVAWTLLVLQNKYEFMHNDFHYGNILIDTSIKMNDVVGYKLEIDADNQLEFTIPVPGILPKIWDLEFATIKGMENPFCNPEDDSMPTEFNKVYDLHQFLTSLLELDIPDEIRTLIKTVYPVEVIPIVEPKKRSDCNSKSSGSVSDTDSESVNSDDLYYQTDESVLSASISSSLNSGEDSIESDSDQAVELLKKTSKSVKRIRTEYLDGDRLLNGVEKRLKLPEPVDILKHAFFNEYRRNALRPTCNFHYKM